MDISEDLLCSAFNYKVQTNEENNNDKFDPSRAQYNIYTNLMNSMKRSSHKVMRIYQILIKLLNTLLKIIMIIHHSKNIIIEYYLKLLSNLI